MAYETMHDVSVAIDILSRVNPIPHTDPYHTKIHSNIDLQFMPWSSYKSLSCWLKIKKKIVAHSSQRNHTSQPDFYNWLGDDNTTG